MCEIERLSLKKLTLRKLSTKRAIKSVLAILLLSWFSPAALAWNTDGHVLIVDLAVGGLSPVKAREVNRIARTLETTFETDERLFLLKNYGTAADLAKIASFPDTVRNVPLGELFAQWGQEVPEPLKHLSDADTGSWHYNNRAHYIGSDEAPQCQVGNEINVGTVFPLLLESYELATEDVSKAILLAFIIHMEADAHQPLHTATSVDRQCNHDLGGNLFCAEERGFTGQCDTTLHGLWDEAVGLFERYDTYPKLYQSVRGKQTKGPAAEELDPQVWLDEGFGEARFIYTLREDYRPDDLYISDGQHIAYTRLMLAAGRLTTILNDL
jgi:hypothetical protein